jgi:hypothetical protein
MFLVLNFLIFMIIFIRLEITSWFSLLMDRQYFIVWGSVVMIVIISTVALYAGFDNYPKKELVASASTTYDLLDDP